MDQEDEKKKKLNDDVIAFMRKRSEAEAPRYTARLKTYLDIQHKHRRAAAARHLQQSHKKLTDRKAFETEGKSAPETYSNYVFKERGAVEAENPNSKRGAGGGGRIGEKDMSCVRSSSRSERTGEVSEGCCRRRRRRSRCRRRRRRSCRRRRRRSCRRRRRRSCRRRRRRSCRRRRRRSCRRRRRSCRRRRSKKCR